MAGGRRSRGACPVSRDSGGRFDAGWSGFTAAPVPGALPPGHYEPGALPALSNPARDRPGAGSRRIDKAGSERRTQPEPRRKIGGEPQGSKPRDAGGPAFCFQERFRGVPRHPHPIARAERTARAMTHVHCALPLRGRKNAGAAFFAAKLKPRSGLTVACQWLTVSLRSCRSALWP